jgi:adenylate cyclase
MDLMLERRQSMSTPSEGNDPEANEYWRNLLLNGKDPLEQRFRPIFGRLPQSPRCKLCYAPFKGYGSALVRLAFNKRQSTLNPLMCTTCEEYIHRYIGGAEIELTMLFADIRGSTTLAEQMSVSEFRGLIDRFYKVGSAVLVEGEAFVDKLVGDEVSGGFVPGFSGPQHARRAIEAAQKILALTGHDDPEGPWAPVGVGVHTGVAYVGVVGSPGGVLDFTALGDAPNTASRLASNAAAGEILVSQESWTAAGMDMESEEQRELSVKGRQKPVRVHILRVGQGQAVSEK